MNRIPENNKPFNNGYEKSHFVQAKKTGYPKGKLIKAAPEKSVKEKDWVICSAVLRYAIESGESPIPLCLVNKKMRKQASADVRKAPV